MTIVWAVYGIVREAKIFSSCDQENWFDENYIWLIFPCITIDSVILKIM